MAPEGSWRRGRHRLGRRYRLMARLPPGRWGRVWHGLDLHTGESVAIRVLAPGEVHDRAALRCALSAEGAVRTLRDPQVVTIRDVVEERSRLAIITDFVDAGSLACLLRGEPVLPPATAVALGAQVMAGLAALHAIGVTHGDVRAANVMLASYWRRLTVGSARLTDARWPGLHDEAAATPADDVRSAGVLLHRMLLGSEPASVPGQGISLDLPPRLWNALTWLVAEDPQRRPTAAAAAEILGELVDPLRSVRPLRGAPSGWQS